MTDFEFAGLDSLYEYLEHHAADFKYTHEIGDHFQKLRDKLAQLKDSVGAEQAQWEVDAFNFEVKDGRLHWKFQGTDNEGNPFEYPSMERLGNRACAHFSLRQAQSKNPVLRARYSHILWEGPTKNQNFATDAISAYLQLIPTYEAKDRAQPDEHFGLDIVTCLEAAFLLAVQSRTDIALPRAEVLRVLADFPESSSSWFNVRYTLTNLIMENRKHFVHTELSGLPDICLKTAETLLPRNTHSTITMYELGQKVDQKLGTETFDWNRKIAEAYEALMNQRDKEAMSAGHFCEKALEYFRKVKDQSKVEELERKREEYSKKIQLHSVSTKIDLTEHIKWCKAVAKELADKESEKIIAALVMDNGLLPNPDDVSRLAHENLKNHPLLAFLTETILDDRGHVVQYVSGKEQKQRAELLKTFDFFMRMDKLYLINEVIFAGFVAEKLTMESIRRHLEKYSWISQPIRLQVAKHIVEYRWIDLLGAGLTVYFETLQSSVEGKQIHHSLVLAIDSLTIKFEGLVRDLCRLNGVITTYDKPDNIGRVITHEKDLNVLLREPILEKLLEPVDLLFLKYLLTEKLGKNLRHKVAHCLMNREDYYLGNAHLLFLGIMRLSNFQVKEAKSC